MSRAAMAMMFGIELAKALQEDRIRKADARRKGR